ncbi:hypothetical protein, partial [Pseudomonas fluorescens]|uniref:hypothetical protein n=1 Tax=Pseudomonas fluorescens TaxID=294 RepID=UPI00177AA7F7
YIGTRINSRGYESNAIPRGYEEASFRRNAKDSRWIAGPITVVVPKQDSIPGFTFKGTTDGVGLKGPGKLIRSDGFQLEGNFDYGEMPLSWIAQGGYTKWMNDKMIASYAYGYVKVSWPDGATFEGETLDFYPFNRSSSEVTCLPSYFYGNGLLRRPGKKDYIGLVHEGWVVEPVSKEDFLEHIQKFGDCPAEALAAQAELNNRQAAYDAEMQEGRRRADAILSADLSSLSNKIANDMARVESASRGSSLEMDRENERKNAVLHEILVNSQDRAQSSSKKSNQASSTASTKIKSDFSKNASVSNTSGASQVGAYGPIYVIVYTFFKNSKSDDKNVVLMEKVTPIKILAGGGKSSGNPEEQVKKAVMASYWTYIKGLSKFPQCSGDASSGSDGCYGRTPYLQIGRSEAEVNQKLQGVGESSWRNVVHSTAFSYPTSVFGH